MPELGTYGGRAVQRREGAGSFAGDPDQQRQGSFADTDRVVIVTSHQGHAIFLVDLREIAASEADARLEKLARAA